MARVGEQGCTDWWRLRRGAGILIDDARQAGLQEAVALSDRLCEMADHVLLGLVSVGLAAEPVTVEVRDSMRSLFFGLVARYEIIDGGEEVCACRDRGDRVLLIVFR